jgi:ribosomal protein L9
MPSPSSSIERIDKSQRKKEQDPVTVLEVNDKTRAELEQKSKQMTQQKKWKKSFGSTSATSPDGTIDVTTTGFKMEKKDVEITLGAANVSEQKKP